ncbi:MAG: CoA-binding protein [Gammaproteobacteria bacterium]
MHQNPSDDQIRTILANIQTVAMAGASDKSNRPVYGVMKFLQREGIRCIPVNPRLAGREVLGETACARLQDVPVAVDMVDCFINPERVEPIVEAAIDIGAKIVWLQLGVINEAAAAKATDAGLTVIMDRCPAIEWGRLQPER